MHFYDHLLKFEFLALELQMSLQPSRLPSTVARQLDMNQFLTVWNFPGAANNPRMSTLSCLSGRDVVGNIADDDLRPDSAFVYSADPDHETDDDEDRAAKQAEKTVQSLMATVV